MPQTHTRLIALLCSLLLPVSAWASLVRWTGKMPGSLQGYGSSAEQLAALTGDGILIYAHAAQPIQLPTFASTKRGKFYSAAVVLPVPSHKVAALLSDYSGYAQLFPTLKSAKMLEQRQHISQVKYRIHIPTPIPVLNFKDDVILQHQRTDNSIETLVIDAPIPYGAGKIEWFALSAHQTLVTVTHWGDLAQPKGFLFRTILNALPDAKLGLPAGTNAFILEALQRKFKSTTPRALPAGDVPAPELSVSQMNKIRQISQKSQEPVSFILPAYQVSYGAKQEIMRFSSSYQYYAQPASKLKPWLEPQAYQHLFPRQIKKVHIQQPSARQLDANYKISVGLGVIQIPFDFKLRFQAQGALEQQFQAVGGDLRYVQGGMQILPQAKGSLLNVTSAMNIDAQAPFLLRAMRSMPYHELLPALGGNTVLTLKIQQKIK